MANINKDKAPVKATPLVMTEEMQKAIDLVKNHPEIEGVYTIVSNNYETINDALSMSFGIGGWFEEYIKSDTFVRLSPENRAKAFNIYTDIRLMFNIVEDYCAMHKTGLFKE